VYNEFNPRLLVSWSVEKTALLMFIGLIEVKLDLAPKNSRKTIRGNKINLVIYVLDWIPKSFFRNFTSRKTNPNNRIVIIIMDGR